MKPRGVPDFLLFFLAVLLIGFGITMVLSASSIFAYAGQFTIHGCDYCGGDGLYFVKKQIMWAVIGLIGMLIAMNIPFSFYKKNFLLIALICLFFLITVYIPGIGYEVKGARSWISIGPFSGQPSEFAKLGLILYLAALIAKKGEMIRQFKTGLFPPLVITGLFFLLVALQPDLGSSFILLGVAGIIMICGGAKLSHLFVLTVLPFSIFVTIYVGILGHASSRISSYLDPWSDPLGAGYQIVQSYYAIAQGGISGSGFGKSIQKYLYLPEAHTDFIFAIIAEELGFIGTTIFLLVFLTFLLRGIYISLKVKDTFSSLVGIGIISMIGLQALINIGGVTGAIPLTGVTLPFISYGGSSLLSCMIATGILLSVSREVNRQKVLEKLQAHEMD